MESRRQPRLFLCGEMLAALGAIGGCNFLWAWATGRAAGIGAALGIAPGDGRHGVPNAARRNTRTGS